MMIIKFPAKKRILDQLGWNGGNELEKLDAEIRQIDASISSLQNKRRILLLKYRGIIEKIAALAFLFLWLEESGVERSIHDPYDPAPFCFAESLVESVSTICSSIFF